jgi:hypothetical protein
MQQKSRVRVDIEPELKVEVEEDARALIITLPGTDYQITYRKLADISGVSGIRLKVLCALHNSCAGNGLSKRSRSLPLARGFR